MGRDPASRDASRPVTPGEGITWAELVRALLAHARGLGVRPEVAEDLVHDALVVMLRDPKWYDPSRGSASRVLSVVVTNRFLDRCRSRSRRRAARGHLELLTSAPAPPADHAPIEREAAASREAFLARLEDDERALFVAWCSQRRGDLDGPAAAASLGLTYRQYEAAKKRLRRRCAAILTEMGLRADDLISPPPGEGVR